MLKFTHKIAFTFLTLGLSVGCLYIRDGKPALRGEMYFPISLAMTQSGRLLVVNSDFDLQYSQGTVQSLDLERIRAVAQVPCNSDDDCKSGFNCDSTRTEENSQAPSYVCVDTSSPYPCGAFGEKSTSERAVSPGRCGYVHLESPQDGGTSLILDVAETAAFATEGLLLRRPCTAGDGTWRNCEQTDSAENRVQPRGGEAYPERLFIPIRGDTAIHYLDLDEDGHFVCGRAIEAQEGMSFSNAGDKELRCQEHKIRDGYTYGLDKDDNLVKWIGDLPPAGELDENELKALADDPTNSFEIQPEPIDLAASAGGQFIAVSHQVKGIVSTLLNDWIDEPELIYITRGLSTSPLGIAVVPEPVVDGKIAAQGKIGANFLLSYRTAARIDLLHLDDDGLFDASFKAQKLTDNETTLVFRPTLSLVDSTQIATNYGGTHSRGVAIDDRSRSAEIKACGGDEACEAEALKAPLDVYVANRSPSSMLVGRTGGHSQVAKASLLPQFYDNVPLSGGPSRVVLGNVLGPDGSLRPRVFIICFDAALVYVYDPELAQIDGVIRTGRGPYSLAFDYEVGLMYVAHFTDSYVGAVSIDQRFPFTYGATLATLNKPQPPKKQQSTHTKTRKQKK